MSEQPRLSEGSRALPRRHDLVWLDPAAVDRIAACGADRPHLGGWLARSRPFVVGRRDVVDPDLRLGFTLPGIGQRQRVSVRAPLDAVAEHRPPPSLADIASAAPAAWHRQLRDLAVDLDGAGLTARCYGSLVNQAISDEPCLRPDSDVDVIVDGADAADAFRALAILERHGNGIPRIDGELRLHGWAVAWRELAAAIGTGRHVLAKSDTAVELLPAERILGDAVARGDYDDRHSLPK